ncbi:uncharacterized protein NESG_01316 [Nematocida ausubeli]|uniref:Uncharacterized protein n=1 Tax=Nematocida ausubeli (strain ATCC PRA-371 / ERTm2) TaxID=1913371 RepID=A0A086J232_NEMA1|nr:uncharacterized protein NESG_01316 [Nematocida ausubeli]KFG26200.1 hypothetical protein NESG_01316 [Nematocida ausubeli]
MASLFLEQISKSGMLTCCGVHNHSLYFVHENVIEFLDTHEKIKLPCNIKWALSNESAIYALTDKAIYIIKNRLLSDLEIVPVLFDLQELTVKCSWIKDNKILILSENEVIIYNLKTTEILRYTPYGHKILSMEICHAESSEFLLLLSSHNQNVVRVLSTQDRLEETLQFSVPSTVYKIYSLQNKEVLLIEPDKITLHNTSAPTKTMCFAGALVRAGIVMNGMCVLSLLTNELCYIDVEKFCIVQYARPKIIAQGMINIEKDLYLYNKLGDICVVSSEADTEAVQDEDSGVLKKGCMVVKVKATDTRNTSVQLIEQRGRSTEACKLIRKYKERANKMQIKEEPVQLLKNETYFVIRYKSRIEVQNSCGVTQTMIPCTDALAAYLCNNKVHILCRSGRLLTYTHSNISAECLLCKDTQLSKNKSKNVLAEEHSHENEIVFADVHRDLLVYASADGVYLYSLSTGAFKLLGREYAPASLSIYNSRIMVCEEDVAKVIHVNSLLEVVYSDTLLFSGCMCIALSDAEYLLQRYNGSLWYIDNDKLTSRNIKIGSVIIKDRAYYEDSIMINTDGGTVLISRQHDEVIAQHIDRGKNQVNTIDKSSSTYLAYRYSSRHTAHYVDIYNLFETPEYIKVRAVNAKEVRGLDAVDVIDVENQTLVISRHRRMVNTMLSAEFCVSISLFGHKYLDEVRWSHIYSVYSALVGSKICIAINRADESELVALRVRGNKIVQIESISFKGVRILGISKYGSIVYCSTSNGLIAYKVTKTGFVESAINNVYLCSNANSRYEVCNKHLVEYALSQIKLYKIDLKKGITSLANPPLFYVDRVKNHHKVIGVFNSEFFLMGYAHENRGSLVLLQRKGSQQLHKILSISLPSGVAHIERASLSLIGRSDTLLVQTETGSVYKIELVGRDFANDFFGAGFPDTQAGTSDIRIFADEELLSSLKVETFTDKKPCIASNIDKISALSLIL